MEEVWIADLHISTRTAAKIQAKHGITVTEVRDALQCVEGLRGATDEHPEHGLRLISQLTLRNRPALAVLFDAGHPLGDVWNLGSVYFRKESA